jgi:hypothetical protein
MRKTLIILGTLLVTLLLVFGACAPATAPEPTQGQIAYKVTLVNAEWGIPKLTIAETPEGRLKWAASEERISEDTLFLTYAITNTGSEKLNFLYWHIRATDQEGNIGTNGETTFDLPEEIYPGETYQGTASWEFSPKATEVTVHFVYEHVWTERTVETTLIVRR